MKEHETHETAKLKNSTCRCTRKKRGPAEVILCGFCHTIVGCLFLRVCVCLCVCRTL